MDRRETVFTMEATPVKYGPGAAAEAGWELRRLGVTRALIVTDPGIVAAGIVDRVRGAIDGAGVACEVFDGVAVEPTLEAVEAAAAFASDGASTASSASAGARASTPPRRPTCSPPIPRRCSTTSTRRSAAAARRPAR